MDHAVAIVEAYLQINGYFTVAEYPVIEAMGPRHYATATDLDLLAVRFAGAGRMVPGKGEEIVFEPDPELGIESQRADMLIGEVKEGHAELNPATLNPDVLRVVLARFGCCSMKHSAETVDTLIHQGNALTSSGHRVRLVAFGTLAGRRHRARFASITLGHAIGFIEQYLRDHWEVLRHAQFKHPALGLFMVREKARREAAGMK